MASCWWAAGRLGSSHEIDPVSPLILEDIQSALDINLHYEIETLLCAPVCELHGKTCSPWEIENMQFTHIENMKTFQHKLPLTKHKVSYFTFRKVNRGSLGAGWSASSGPLFLADTV